MKKVFAIVLTAGMLVGALTTQKTFAQAFGQGKVAITLGYGFGNLTKSVFNVWDNEIGYKATGLGPFHFRGEYGLSDNIGLGLSVNYIGVNAKYTHDDIFTGTTYEDKISYSSISALGRMNIHFAVTDKLDPFFGIGVGYRTGTWKFTSDDPDYLFASASSITPFGFEATIGLRYYFTPNIGLYIEAGIAKSMGQGGLALSF